MTILYNADGEPLGERKDRQDAEQMLADLQSARRKFRAFARRAFLHAGLITLGIVIGKVVL